MALMQDYYSKKALSNSGIKKILKTPAHFKHWLTAEKKSSKSLILGELMHYFLLRPDLVPEEIAVYEKGKTLNGKLANRFILANPGKFICTREQYEFASAAANKVLKDRRVCRLLGLANAKREEALYLDVNGVPGKALYDLISPEIILDVKTHKEEGGYFDSAESFDNKFFQYGYDIQGAWYQKLAEMHDGIKRDVLFLVIEMEEPHGVILRGIEQDDLDSAWLECEKAIEIYKECLATDRWPSYEFPSSLSELQYVKKPRWRKLQAVQA